MNTDRIPLGERVQKEIVAYIEAVGDEAESNFLEIKSELDLAAKEGIVKVAKFLLGASNRKVADAGRNFKGHAVLVAGAKKGESPGIKRGHEAHELDDALRPYLGPDFPPFELGRIPVGDDREILFVISSPPQVGDTIFPCHKTFQGEKGQSSVEDGAIYVRGKSNTRPARADEIKALIDRARGGSSKPPIELSVRLEEGLYGVIHLDEYLNFLYNFEQEQYLAPEEGAGGGPGITIGQSIMRAGEKQRRDAAVAEWASRKDEYLSEGVEHLLGAALPGMWIALESIDRFVAKPHLTVTFKGCHLYDYIDPKDADFSKVVRPIPRSTFENFAFPYVPQNYAVSSGQYPVSWANSGDDAIVVLTPDDLRPNTEWVTDNDDYVIVVNDPQADIVEVEWMLTEDANDVVTQGSLRVPVAKTFEAADLVDGLFGD